jgi:hypothetical protein
MTGKVLNLTELIVPDQIGTEIARKWVEWNMFRAPKVADWDEVRRYVYATDTTKTSNSKLPWKNKTTIPKLCQIRDNLHANYIASLFPNRKWLLWEAANKDASAIEKKNAITNYMSWVISQDSFKSEIAKCVLDYIDYGNAFGTVDWTDQRTETDDKTQVGYVGPSIQRISPLDIVFNPTASTFESSPKIIRSLVSLGEIKDRLRSMSPSEDQDAWKDLYQYLRNLRQHVHDQVGTELHVKDAYYNVDGFGTYRQYLESNYVEVLTFYGDLYDYETDTLLKNHKIMVVDRHKVISKKPNPSYFGFPPIFHVGWRKRQDNLWAMGPLDNLVGLQYRIDHIENLKADVFDLITFPPLKIKGYVEPFTWGPFQHIHVGDDGDVEMLAPPFQVLQANVEIENLQRLMEEMAGSPKEAMGFRSPGEKTKYEVQRLENAASRIFQNKIGQFEEQFVERLLNALLELARRNLSSALSIPVFDNEYNITVFTELSPLDLTGAGRVKPIAARHFAERAELVQNLTAFFGSQIGMDQAVKEHFSSVQTAKLFEDLLDLTDYGIVQPYVRISEMADAQRLLNASQQQVQGEAMAPNGIFPGGEDPMPEEMMPQGQPQPQPEGPV